MEKEKKIKLKKNLTGEMTKEEKEEHEDKEEIQGRQKSCVPSENVKMEEKRNYMETERRQRNAKKRSKTD